MVFRSAMAAGIVALMAVAGSVEAKPATQPKPAAQRTSLDRSILQVQVILDRLGFSPGVIDGRRGQSLTAALKGFQTARGLKSSGTIDQQTLGALSAYRAVQPTVTLTLSERALAGPYFQIPKGMAEQAKLPALGYRSPLEKLAEMFHTTPQVLVELNSPQTMLRPGTKVVFPNTLPSSRAYPESFSPEWKATLNALNVSAEQPTVDKVVVDKSDGVLRAYSGDRLVAQFSATMGSANDPLPIGKWTVKGAAQNPPFHYNPALFWDAKSTDQKATLQPGPNGPVGVVWLDLSKEHYGIHGTPEPQNIGRTESHGCIRLTNWDVARLSLMVKPGTPAIFQP